MDVTSYQLPPQLSQHIHVAPSGSDAASGTAFAPFRSIARAARAALPGTTVHVAAGTYEGGFRTNASGDAAARIAYVSSTRWGARIVLPAASVSPIAWDNRGSHVDIVGFHLDGSAPAPGIGWTHGIYNGGAHVAIRDNWIHDIAKDLPCTSAGGSAIGVDSYYRGVQAEVSGNLVHDIGPPGCRYVQGIYFSTSGTVSNNVVYRVSEGAIHLWHDAADVTVSNNTVVASNTGIIVGGGDYYYSSGPNDRTIVANNIVYDNQMGISEQGETGSANRYIANQVFQNALYDFRLKNGLSPEATVVAAPRFVAYRRTGTPDLRVTADSPGNGKGAAGFAPPRDMDGKLRAGEGAEGAEGVDIGAFQH